MNDAVLQLAALVVAHLVADFVLQTDRVVADKAASGRRAWRGLALHGVGVAAGLVPFVVVYAAPGVAVLVAVTASHLLIDRAKVLLTRRAQARALADAHGRHADRRTGVVELGAAWTPAPAALFALDQLAHLLVLGAAWTLWLRDAGPVPAVATALDGLLGGTDPEIVHRTVVLVLVLVALLIVNVRAGAIFVATLVHPREALRAVEPLGEGAERPAAPPPAWRVRLGPFEAVAEPLGGGEPARPAPAHASPARVGATIGVLERLLIATFVLTGSEAAIGFVVAAKTLARFRQLDDRDFAEYYLLGTLASVSVALGSALLASAALAAVGLPPAP